MLDISGIIKQIIIFYMIEVFWFAVQGLVVSIAILSPITMFITAIVKTLIRVKEDDAMGNKLINYADIGLYILYTVSANLAGSAMLAKVF